MIHIFKMYKLWPYLYEKENISSKFHKNKELQNTKWIFLIFVFSHSPSALKVRLGEYDVSTVSEPLKYEEFDVSRIVVYPTFNNRTLMHDIALVRLSRPAKRRANVNVVCMPNEGVTNNELILSPRCFVTGWGKTVDSKCSAIFIRWFIVLN